jgi:hypothetical protein
MTTPLNVLLVEANRPLVYVGGDSLNDLREDFFDNAFYGAPNVVSAYDIALSGGEPYAVWR